MEKWRSPRGQLVQALVISSLVSAGLFSYGVWHSHSLVSSYLTWNLFLAWLPLLIVVRLMQVLRRKLWSSWEAMLLSFLWILFLPNSFYMVSDLIHLPEVMPADLLYYTVVFVSFVINGLALGFSSLYLIHWQLRRRFSDREAAAWIGLTLLLCSFAIYLGRDLRWNTWDVVLNPAGLLFDVSDRLQHPAAYPQMMLIVAAFFVLLASLYNLLWRSTRLFIRHQPPGAVQHQTTE